MYVCMLMSWDSLLIRSNLQLITPQKKLCLDKWPYTKCVIQMDIGSELVRKPITNTV